MKRTRAFVQLTCAAFSVGLLVPGIQAQFRIDSTGVTGPVHDFNSASPALSSDTFSLQFDPASGQLADYSSVSITVNAPAGFQFVVDPPPGDIGWAELTLSVDFGSGTDTSISGTDPSLTFGGVAGTAPGLALHEEFISSAGNRLFASATADLTSATSIFSFTSVTFSFNYNNAGITSIPLGDLNDGTMAYIMNFNDVTSADLSQPWMRLAAVPVPEPAGAEVFAASLLAAVAGGRVCRRSRANA